jgi:hypothetical protein
MQASCAMMLLVLQVLMESLHDICGSLVQCLSCCCVLPMRSRCSCSGGLW